MINYEKLREERKRKGFSQEDLAHFCQVSRQAVSRWENGSSVPDTENLLQISKALEVSIDYLMDNEDMQEQKVMMRLDYDDFMKQEEKHSVFEYKSKKEWLGLPLVHIHYTRGMLYNRYAFSPRRKTRVAKGIIAIGDVAIGGLAIGMYSLGLMTLGLFSLGFFSLSVLALGFFTIGILSIGFSSFGILAIGIYACGVLAIGWHIAVGVMAIGNSAVGVEAIGKALTINFGENDEILKTCAYNSGQLQDIRSLVENTWLPYPMKWFINMLKSCL